MINPKDSVLRKINSALAAANGAACFASLTYVSKESGEMARHTVILNGDYGALVIKSLAELAVIRESLSDPLDIQAAEEIRLSLEKTRDGVQDRYTKAGVYTQLGNGLQVNENDGSLEIKGLAHAKTVIVPGVHKVVNSKPLTVAKNKIRSRLPVGKFRTFCLDVGALETLKVSHREIEVTG